MSSSTPCRLLAKSRFSLSLHSLARVIEAFFLMRPRVSPTTLTSIGTKSLKVGRNLGQLVTISLTRQHVLQNLG